MALIAVATMAVAPLSALATAGKSTSRREARGEVTDTSPKLDTWAFLDDSSEDPARLEFYVDAFLARAPMDVKVMPLRVGLAFGGRGPDLPISLDRFELSWPGATRPLPPLTHAQLLARSDGRSQLRRDRMLLWRTRTVPFDASDGMNLPVRFHPDPSGTTYRNDDTEMPPMSWFAELIYFELPPGVERIGPLFELRYRGKDEDPATAATVRFRVEPDPTVHRDAFRRARKQQKEQRKREQPARHPR